MNNRYRTRVIFFMLACFFLIHSVHGQGGQTCDTTFSYTKANPRYPAGTGPQVWIDEAHHNFHTLDGRYCGFAKVLNADGYQLNANREGFDRLNLRLNDILVIANALDAGTVSQDWALPNRSAFSSSEIDSLFNWVSHGGRLFLIVDHMPFPGCAGELASAFGFTFFNGYAEIDNRKNWPSRFSKTSHTLAVHPLTEGIPYVASFTGSAFRIPEGAIPLLSFGSDHNIMFTERAGNPNVGVVPTFSAEGFFQGAIMQVGTGKIAVFGEAAMFSAQTIQTANGSLHFGLNASEAPYNANFLLNIMAWLAE
ncbi:MAG: DUF4350 domain-containing protein [Bacteroidia bacterium]